jgi:hypothetical protein
MLGIVGELLFAIVVKKAFVEKKARIKKCLIIIVVERKITWFKML